MLQFMISRLIMIYSCISSHVKTQFTWKKNSNQYLIYLESDLIFRKVNEVNQNLCVDTIYVMIILE